MRHEQKKKIRGWFKSACTELEQREEVLSVVLSKLGLFNLFVNELKEGGEVSRAITDHILILVTAFVSLPQ